jgi:hypothetical protein
MLALAPLLASTDLPPGPAAPVHRQPVSLATMTEAYVGTNDFAPFNRAELKAQDPETHALMEQIWGAP